MWIHVDCTSDSKTLGKWQNIKEWIWRWERKNRLWNHGKRIAFVCSLLFLKIVKKLTRKPHVSSSWNQQDGRISFRADLRSQGVVGELRDVISIHLTLKFPANLLSQNINRSWSYSLGSMGFMVPDLHSYNPYTGSCMFQHREIVGLFPGIWGSPGGKPNVSFPKEYDCHNLCVANWKLWQNTSCTLTKLRYYFHHPKQRNPMSIIPTSSYRSNWISHESPRTSTRAAPESVAPLNLDWLRLHQWKAARPWDLIRYHTAWDFFETHTLPKKNGQHDIVQTCFTTCSSHNLLQCSKCDLETPPILILHQANFI